MSKVKSIIKLYTQGVSKSSISDRLSLPRNSVKKYIQLFLASNLSITDIDTMSDTDLEQLFLSMSSRFHLENDPRFQSLVSFFPKMEKELKKKGVTKEQQWREYFQSTSGGYGRSQFCYHYAQWYKSRNHKMHIEHKVGDKMYVDYAGDKLSIVDPVTGEVNSIEVFVAILGGSQLTYVDASYSQQKEDFITSCENALHYFGGSPTAIVTDNLKSAVIKSSRYEPSLNDSFRDFASHYSMTVLPAAPYKPTYKALVELSVKYVYRHFYGKLREQTHTSLEGLNSAIGLLLEDYNNKLRSNRPYSRRALFEDIERQALCALPTKKYEIKRKAQVMVMKNGYVCLSEDKHYYSVPYQYVGSRVSILYSANEVEVFFRYERIAVHKRNRYMFQYTHQEEHLAPKFRYQSDWNPLKFIEKAEQVGPYTKAYITSILNSRQHPEQAYKSSQGVLSFASKAGNERLENACQRALTFGELGYNAIRVILEQGKDRDKSYLEEQDDKSLPEHPNVRGKDYYK